MLPAPSRLRSSADFSQAFRGRKTSRHSVVVHFRATDNRIPARVGFVVNSLVGNSVKRHAVVRRLRHVMASHVHELPSGSLVVIRALPSAALATSSELRSELDSAISELVGVAS